MILSFYDYIAIILKKFKKAIFLHEVQTIVFSPIKSSYSTHQKKVTALAEIVIYPSVMCG